MSRFTVTGTIARTTSFVVWEDGAVAGPAASSVELLVELQEEIAQTPTGPIFRAALSPAHVALLTIAAVFDEVLELAGDVPEIAELELPAGATP